MLKNYYKKIIKKQDNDVDTDMAQLEHINNKCYALCFRYIQIYILMMIFQTGFQHSKIRLRQI